MKKILGLALAGALSVAALPAVAADYPLKAPPPPIWTWTGFYIGVSGGGVTSGQVDDSLAGAGRFHAGVDGGLFGGTVGWNWQSGIWVVGLEGDWSWTNLRGTAVCPNPAFTCTGSADWLATVRGRLGVASLGSTLFYVTGGVAWGKAFETFNPVGGGASNSQGATLTGWTAGGGVEFMIAPNWTFKGEVLFVDLGDHTFPDFAAPPLKGGATLYALDFWVFRGGVNFKF
jgi:outer membrane immunogenic protein